MLGKSIRNKRPTHSRVRVLQHSDIESYSITAITRYTAHRAGAHAGHGSSGAGTYGGHVKDPTRDRCDFPMCS